MNPQSTITVSQKLNNPGSVPSEYSYFVQKLTNRTEPKIATKLSESEVRNLISSGVKVHIQ